MHYGEALISELKKDGRYGSFFTYEEYRALHSAGTLEEMRSTIGCTRFAGCLLCEDIVLTYKDLRLAWEEQELSESLRKRVDGFGVSDGSEGAVFVLPLVLLWRSFRTRSMKRQLAMVQQERALLRAKAMNC